MQIVDDVRCFTVSGNSLTSNSLAGMSFSGSAGALKFVET